MIEGITRCIKWQKGGVETKKRVRHVALIQSRCLLANLMCAIMQFKPFIFNLTLTFMTFLDALASLQVSLLTE